MKLLPTCGHFAGDCGFVGWRQYLSCHREDDLVFNADVFLIYREQFGDSLSKQSGVFSRERPAFETREAQSINLSVQRVGPAMFPLEWRQRLDRCIEFRMTH